MVEETKAIGKILVPTAATGLVLYSRAMVSMLFLGYLGEKELARGSLAIGFAIITGYSVLSAIYIYLSLIYISLSYSDWLRYIYIYLSLSFYQSLAHILSVFISSSISIFLSFYLSLDLFDPAIITDSLAAEHRAVAARIAGEVI